MKKIWRLILNNVSSIFSILGICATIYFGALYVPSRYQEAKEERIKNASTELQQSIKELVFSDSTVTEIELNSLLHAEELYLREKYPYSLLDVLTQVQQSFMEDKFLPLVRRQELMKKVEGIKQSLPKESQAIKQGRADQIESFDIFQIGSILATTIIGLIGVLSIIRRYKSEINNLEEINNEVQTVTVKEEPLRYEYEFENELRIILSKKLGLTLQDKSNGYRDRGIDIIFSYSNKNYFIEIKYLQRSKVGLNSLVQLIHYLQDKSGEGWIVYNTDITALVKEKVEEYNKQHQSVRIKLIRITSPEEFEKLLPNLLANGAVGN